MQRLKGVNSAGQDTVGDDHPINIIRKAISLGHATIKHTNKELTEISAPTAHRILREYEDSKPFEKEEIITRIRESKNSFHLFMAKKSITKASEKKSKISLGGSPRVGGVGAPLNMVSPGAP